MVFDASDWLPGVSHYELMTNDDLRSACQRYEAAQRDSYNNHHLRPVSELLADPVAMADEPWDPAADPP